MDTVLVLGAIAIVLFGVKELFILYNFAVDFISRRKKKKWISAIHVGKNEKSNYYRVACELVYGNEEVMDYVERPAGEMVEFFANNHQEMINICQALYLGNETPLYPMPEKNSKKKPSKWVEQKINSGYKLFFMRDYIMVSFLNQKETRVNVINNNIIEFDNMLNLLELKDSNSDEPVVGFRKGETNEKS